MSETAAVSGTSLHRLSLKSGGMVKVQGAEGLSVTAIEGRLWIIQDADVRDYELEPGESLAIGQVGITLIQALTASTFALQSRREASREPRASFSVVGVG